jgi:hypothetical protein
MAWRACCRCQRSITWAGVLSCADPMPGLRALATTLDLDG